MFLRKLEFDKEERKLIVEKCKNKCDTEKVTQGAQTALARMGVWGKVGNESFPRWP